MSTLPTNILPSRGAFGAGARAAALGLGILLHVGSAFVVVGMLSACFYAAPVFGAFGVNALDYVTLADLPTVGLRRLPGTASGLALFAVVLFGAGFGALQLGQYQERYEALRSRLASAPWHERIIELAVPWLLARNVALPVLAAVFCAWQWLSLCVTMGTAETTVLKSTAACQYFVTWTSNDHPPAPPFATERCAAIVGMLGKHAVFYADGVTHVVPQSSIAAIRIAPSDAHPRERVSATAAP